MKTSTVTPSLYYVFNISLSCNNSIPSFIGNLSRVFTIRSSLDYACPVFHYSLPMYLQVELERVQKRALSCIFPRVHYSDALQLAGLESIRAHQEKLTEHLFKSIVNDSRSKITSLLPPSVSISHELRRQRRFATPLVKTNRFANSFIVKSAREAFR